jgi:hypothetical protein
MINKLVSLLFAIILIGCTDVDDLVNSSAQNPVDVYIAGVKTNNAAYWKNNQPYLLSGGDGGEATKICVSNNNVLVLGKKTLDNWRTEYLYWENGNLTNLNGVFNTPAQYVHSITDMEVVGNDVYFVGYTKNPLLAAEIYELVYWKNGVKNVLDNNINNPTFQAKIKVVNNTVYVIGFTSNCFNSCHGIYVNNVFQSFSVGILLKGLAVNDNQVYVYGTNTTTNTGFYKNLATGVETNVGFPGDDDLILLCFDNDNMYYSYNTQIYKNGALFYQLPTVVGITFPSIQDFFVLNNNLYKIIGGLSNNQTIDVNGTTVQTSSSGENFKSLYIVHN